MGCNGRAEEDLEGCEDGRREEGKNEGEENSLKILISNPGVDMFWEGAIQKHSRKAHPPSSWPR